MLIANKQNNTDMQNAVDENNVLFLAETVNCSYYQIVVLNQHYFHFVKIKDPKQKTIRCLWEYVHWGWRKQHQTDTSA